MMPSIDKCYEGGKTGKCGRVDGGTALAGVF